LDTTASSREHPKVRVAVLTTDNREPYREYSNPQPHFGTAPEALLQGFAQLPDAEIHVITCAQQPLPSPEKLAPNIYFHSLHVPKLGWMRTAFLGCIRAIRKKLREIKPDIVHGQGTERECSISAVFSGFPNVLTIHGNMRLIARVTNAPVTSYPWLIARLESFTVPRSRGVVCITRYTQEAIAPLNPRTWVLPNAVDGGFFSVNSKPPADATPLILCVGFVCLRKNQNAFIRALDPLAEKLNFRVRFLGHASPGRAYDDEFLSLVKARSWCEHAGFADREKLKSHFREASLLALPSLEDNCPMTVLEAMAAGVPVVGAKVGGVPDLIEDGKTGLFCDPLDPESMRRAIEGVIVNPLAARERAIAAQAQALRRFHPRVVATRHLEIYREVLGKAS
jgi:glycosyltransferase involved in cell wall biosynthesis